MGGTININENPVSLFFIVLNIHHSIFRMNHIKLDIENFPKSVQ